MSKQNIELSITDFITVMKNAKLTGSRAWGVNKEDSDYDYLIRQEDWKLPLEAKATYYTVMDGKTFNFIVKSGFDYSAWSNATDQMTQLVIDFGKDIIENKASRIFIFTLLRAL